LLQFDQCITSEEHDNLKQLNPDIAVLKFSENTAIGNKSIEDVSSASIPTKIDDVALAPIGDGSIDRSALQDMGAWPIRISDSFRDFMVNRRTSKLQNRDSNFPEDESGRSLTKHWFEKKFQNCEKVHRTWLCFSPPKRCTFLLLLHVVQSELS
jgi:hypothetical protein